MNRKKLLNKAFQRGHLLTAKNKLYRDWIKRGGSHDGSARGNDIAYVLRQAIARNKGLVSENHAKSKGQHSASFRKCGAGWLRNM